MADNIDSGTPPVTDPAANPAADPANQADPQSSLPSDAAAQQAQAEADNVLPEKWKSVKEMADHIKNMEDKYSQLSREVGNKSQQELDDIARTQADIAKQSSQQAVISELVPEFMSNGMNVTEEMQTKLTESGLSLDQIKIGAYEMKDALTKNHSYVGGEENYNIIMEYHAANMTPEQKTSFNHSIQNPANSEALMIGMQTMYERSIGQEQPDGDRVRGNANQNTGNRGYETKAELFADKRYIDSPAGKKDAGAITKYRAKLALTPDSVWK